MSVGKARKESSSKGQSGNAAATRTKKGKFGDKTEEEVMSLLLPDRLGDNMDILFVSFCFEAFKFLIDLHLTTEYYFINQKFTLKISVHTPQCIMYTHNQLLNFRT